MTNLVINVPSEYISLGLVMQSALEQASKGKGRERHASEGEAYEDQIICEVARRVGLGYPLGQAVKKIYESQRLGGESGVAELLGAINYIATAVIVMREGLETAPKAEGCEDLVFDEARMRESMPGIVPQDWPSDFDAPQTREALYQHIVDCNPATYGRARKPTGEELAEMAEEETHG